MSDVFTHHVRHHGTPGDAFAEFWPQFKTSLRSAMRERNLLYQRPSYLGKEFADYQTWRDPGAFKDLADLCYLEAVLLKRGPLQTLLQRSPSVAGAVVTNIHYFLIDRQRKANPAGYRLFTKVVTVLEEAIQQGRFRAQGLVGGKLRNETLLHLAPESAPAPEPIGPGELERLIDDSAVCGQAVRALTGSVNEARQPLLDALDDLRARGAGTLRLGNLLDALRDRVCLFDSVGPGGNEHEALAGIVRTILPDRRYEEDENFQERIKRLRAEIDRRKGSASVKEKKTRLLDRLAALVESPENLAWANVYQELGISKSTFWEYIKDLVALALEIDDEG
jgi:hypothetical protein